MSKTVSYDGFIHIVNALLPLVGEGKLSVEEFGRVTMLAFGDVSSVHSGLVSSKLCWTHEPTGRTYRQGNVTHEHFKTRTATCRDIANEFLAGTLTSDRLLQLIEEGRKVHFVTEQENIDLRPFQQSDNYPTWEEQYQAAGIELVEDPGLFGNRSYWYRVDGVTYADKHEVAAAYNCGLSTVVNRSRNSKYPNWEEHKYIKNN